MFILLLHCTGELKTSAVRLRAYWLCVAWTFFPFAVQSAISDDCDGVHHGHIHFRCHSRWRKRKIHPLADDHKQATRAATTSTRQKKEFIHTIHFAYASFFYCKIHQVVISFYIHSSSFELAPPSVNHIHFKSCTNSLCRRYNCTRFKKRNKEKKKSKKRRTELCERHISFLQWLFEEGEEGNNVGSLMRLPFS